MHMKQLYDLNHLGQFRLKRSERNIRKVATWSHLFTPDLENDQTHITLRDNPNCNVTPLSSHTTLNGAAAAVRCQPQWRESIAVHEVVPKVEAMVKTVRALNEQYGDWHLAVECHRLLQKWTHGDGGSQKLAAAMTL
jgi:hypothetical protein